MPQFDFVNRVWIKNAPRGRGIRILLIILGILLALVTVVQVAMGDANEINWLRGVLLPAVLITQAFFFTRQGRYLTVHTHIICDENKIEIILFHINRFDGAGTRNEKYNIEPDTVIQFQYSRHLNSIRIMAHSVAGKTPVYGPQYEMILYPPVGEIPALISALEKSLCQNITHMDE